MPFIVRPRFDPASLKAHAVAALIVVIATALRLVFGPWLVAVPFVVFFPAVILVAFLCGSAPGFLAIFLSTLVAWLFFLPATLTELSAYQTALFAVGSVTVVAVIGAMRASTADVRRLNATLQVSESKFRGLLEAAPDAMVIVDEQGSIVLINARTEELFGYRRNELVGQPIAILIPERDRAKYLEQLVGLLTGSAAASKVTATDLNGLRKGGAEFPIEISFAEVKAETGILVFSAIRDIGLHRQIEAKLAEANRAKSDFLAHVSHELRTPLNAIIGFSELIRDAVIGPLDARYREYGGDINESGRHLQNIINDILDISKIERGRLELHDDVVAIGETIATCHRIIEPMAAAAGVALTIEVPPVLPLIRSDQLRLQQILLNLMSNAVKFTPAGGRVIVTAAVEAEGAVIAIRDTGIGMRQEDIAIALEPFRQIEGAFTRRFAGTGLGLPLAKALVELHGGRLDVESAPRVGTTVRIRLPAERMMSAAA